MELVATSKEVKFPEVKAWMYDRHKEWREGRTQTDSSYVLFGKWIGLEDGTIDAYMNGRRRPSGDNLVLIASKLGLGIYDAVGVPRPTGSLMRIIVNWESIPEHLREQYARDIEAAAETTKHTNQNSKNVAANK